MRVVPRVIDAKVNYNLSGSKMAEVKEALRLQMEKISECLPKKIFVDSSEEEDNDDTDRDPNYEPGGKYNCIIRACFYFLGNATCALLQTSLKYFYVLQGPFLWNF